MDINVNKHSSIRIGDVYIDPFKISDNSNDAKYIFITHSHYDHYSPEDINKVINKDTIFVCTGDVAEKIKMAYDNKVLVIEPNNEYFINDISFCVFNSYNINKSFHPFNNGWVGYVINVGGIRYAILGDTDLTNEVKEIGCDVLFVPIGGIYTMDAKEASELTNIIKPSLVIPVHYNDIVGDKKDEEEFIRGLNGINYKVFL